MKGKSNVSEIVLTNLFLPTNCAVQQALFLAHKILSSTKAIQLMEKKA
jgi:hypothetical protein